MTKEFDPTRPVQTRDGRPARIIATDLNGYNGDRLVAIIRNSAEATHEESVFSYQPDGRVWEGEESPSDLVNTSAVYAADRIEDEVAYVSLGDSYSVILARRTTDDDTYPIVRLTIKRGQVDSAEFVTVDEVEAA